MRVFWLEQNAEDVRSCPQEDKPGAKGAMGEGEDSRAKAPDLGGWSQADCGSTEGKVGEGEARSVIAGADPLSGLPGVSSIEGKMPHSPGMPSG